MKSLLSVLFSSLGASVILGIIGFLLRNIIMERLKAAVNFEYEQKIEAVRLQGQKELEVFRQELSSRVIQNQNKTNVISEALAKLIELRGVIHDIVQYSRNNLDASRNWQRYYELALFISRTFAIHEDTYLKGYSEDLAIFQAASNEITGKIEKCMQEGGRTDLDPGPLLLAIKGLILRLQSEVVSAKL